MKSYILTKNFWLSLYVARMLILRRGRSRQKQEENKSINGADFKNFR